MMVRTFPQQCNDIFPDKESAARHEEDECPMNIFGPKQRAQIKAEDSELKECKVVLSRVDDFSNPPKVDETIVKQEVDDDDEEHELRIDEEEEDDDLDDIDDDLDDTMEEGIGSGGGGGGGTASGFLTLKPPAAVMNMVNLPPPIAGPPPLPPALHHPPPLAPPTLSLRPLAPTVTMPQQIQVSGGCTMVKTKGGQSCKNMGTRKVVTGHWSSAC